jgi:hypothetical protein
MRKWLECIWFMMLAFIAGMLILCLPFFTILHGAMTPKGQRNG